MTVRFTTLVLVMAMASGADTLRLRNGRTVSGNFLGGSADEVRFMVDDQVQKFPRADVVEVSFTSIMAPEVDVAPAPPPKIAAEPDVAGMPFLRGANGLIPLEREYAMMVRNNSPYGMGGSGYRIQGSRSPVRVRQGDRLVFVIRMNSGDPRQFNLYRLESRMNYRQTPPSMGGAPMGLQVTITKVSDSVWEITPTRGLFPGEYAMSPMNMNETYCFGVD
jgi:hypothetical protein